VSGWFGESWGAPCCKPDDHVETPVDQTCLRCGEPIASGDQGLTMVHVESCDPPVASVRATHLDCFLKQILPHGPDCPRCRGMGRNQHALRCEYRRGGSECNCVDIEDV
jgi:hypothetical protein